MFRLLFVMGLNSLLLSFANADQLNVQLLPNVDAEPTKVVYKSYFPLTFMVTVINSNTDTDKCKGIVGDQFGIIGVYGTTKGLNIIPSWEEAAAETFKIDINFLDNDTIIDSMSFTGLGFAPEDNEGGVFIITIDYSVITVLSNSRIPYSKVMDPAYLTDFIEEKFLSLSFFQPFQDTPAVEDDVHRDVNRCRFVLDYNGKYIWRPGQPFVIGQN